MKTNFIQRSTKHFEPFFPHQYDLRKSVLGLDRMIEKEKSRLLKDRLKEIKNDIKLIQRSL
jgi:hypothetical protein